MEADNYQPVRAIRYSYDQAVLLEGVDTRVYDADASHDRFESVCRSAIAEAFPSASSIDFDALSISSVAVDDDPDHPDVPLIRHICERVMQNDNWLVPLQHDELLTAVEAREELGLPVALVRYGCSEGLIDGAKRKESRWMASRSSFRQFRSNCIFGNTETTAWISKRTTDGTIVFHGIDQGEFWSKPIDSDIADGDLWIIPSEIDLPSPFSDRNCYFRIPGSDTRRIEFLMFGDISDFQHPQYSFTAFCGKFVEQSKRMGHDAALEGMSARLTFLDTDFRSISVQLRLQRTQGRLSDISRDTHLALANGPLWKPQYASSEKPFCDEVIEPLLKRMKFHDIENRHGNWEFGKDFTFSERTSVGHVRHYALQAKAGDVSGAIAPRKHQNRGGERFQLTPLSTILEQMDDAFAIPYRFRGTGEHRFISAFIIAISGSFTDNAKEKLWWQLRKQGRIGMVYVWDWNKIEELIGVHWLGQEPSEAQHSWSLQIDEYF